MKTKIIDNWEVELTNDRGDTLTLKGEWYADFFKEYENKQLTLTDVVGQSELLKCECTKSEKYYDPIGDIERCQKCEKAL